MQLQKAWHDEFVWPQLEECPGSCILDVDVVPFSSLVARESLAAKVYTGTWRESEPTVKSLICWSSGGFDVGLCDVGSTNRQRRFRLRVVLSIARRRARQQVYSNPAVQVVSELNVYVVKRAIARLTRSVPLRSMTGSFTFMLYITDVIALVERFGLLCNL